MLEESPVHQSLSVPQAFPNEIKRYLGDLAQTGSSVTPYLQDALFNGCIHPAAQAVVRCVDEITLSTAIQIAADHQIPIAVLAGGHDFWGRGFNGQSMVLDVRPLSGVVISPAGESVTVQGGALSSHLLSTIPQELATVTGTVRSVGLVGFTSSGGYGKLNSCLGLGCDCVRSVRVALADGSSVNASESENSDLFWAVRGGGTGFGAVTSMTMSLHRLGRLLTATLMVPLDSAKDTLLYALEQIQIHPFELSTFGGFVSVPGQGPVLFLAPMWTGSPSTGEAFLGKLENTFGATKIESGWKYYRETFDDVADDQAHPKGFHYDLQTKMIRNLDEDVIEILIAAAKRFTSTFSAILLHDFHGAASRVPADATAFHHREDHFLLELIAAWPPQEMGKRWTHQSWRQQLSRDLEPYSLPGTYVALAGPEDAQQAKEFYANAAERLEKIKQHYDPQDLFRAGMGRLTTQSVEQIRSSQR